MKILVTRPEPGATATAARLTGLGHQPVLAPCLRIDPRTAALPKQPPAAVIITSMQAVAALPGAYHDLPVFCVGDATAGRLREAGFRSVESAAGDARDLLRLIAGRRLPGQHLLAAGERQGLALARQLRDAGIAVQRRAVYTARPLARLPPPVSAALLAGGLGAALFYSSETARAFARLTPAGTARLPALVLSPAIAAVLHGLPWAEIRVAVSPTEADLLALLA